VIHYGILNGLNACILGCTLRTNLANPEARLILSRLGVFVGLILLLATCLFVCGRSRSDVMLSGKWVSKGLVYDGEVPLGDEHYGILHVMFEV